MSPVEYRANSTGRNPESNLGVGETMKVLSIKPPWAGLILDGIKDIENRTWKTVYRGPLLIHSEGAIQGRVDLVNIVILSDSSWFTGPYGWVIKNPIRFKEAIPCKGKLSIFEFDPKKNLDIVRIIE